MNWLDIVMLCLAGIGFMKGLFDGFIKQVVSLIALVVAIFFCGKAAGWLKEYILKLDWIPAEGVTIVSYIVGFLLIIGVFALAGEIMNRVINVTPLGIVNHLAGGIFGLGIMVIFVSLTLNFLEIIDRNSTLISREIKVESRFYYPIKEIIPTIYPNGLFSIKE